MPTDNVPLLKIIPTTAQRILDIGCADGSLGAALKRRQACYVVGVEIDAEQAQKAGSVLDEVYAGDIAQLIGLFPRRQFDCIIFGDVLEHLVDPGVVLEAARSLLTEGGRLAISLPNARHWTVLQNLLEGRWEYEDAGLLDSTHLHLFTRASSEDLLRGCSYEPRLKGEIRTQGGEGPSPRCIRALAEQGIDTATLETEAQVYQYLFEARPVWRDSSHQMTSIVIPIHNLWEQTELCLNSIRDHTAQSYEVVVVDNASDDDTARQLQEFAASWPRLRVVTNGVNASYAVACNQGAACTEGRYVLFLNNDTIVPEGWLGRLQAVMERHPETVIVGPVTNYAAGVQRIQYDDPDEDLSSFAGRRAVDYVGQDMATQSVVGFCMLVRRDVFDEVGAFDEQFVNGFEEHDLCLRAAVAGYECCIAQDTFVWHTGSQTFQTTLEGPADLEKLAQENYDKFLEKWPLVIPTAIGATRGSVFLFRPKRPPQVFWAFLSERAIVYPAVNAIMDVAMSAGNHGFVRISVPYGRTDAVRNMIIEAFRSVAASPDDVLVMLDCDHTHPPDIIERLASRPEGVITALAFRRSAPFEPMWFVRQESGRLLPPATYEPIVYKCDAAGTAAVAIKRWVFDKLEEAGHPYFFKYTYTEDKKTGWQSSEDMYFATICEEAGIRHHVDCSLVTPHLRMDTVTEETWAQYRDEHPEIVHEKNSV